MTITALPTPPSRSDPANFAARGDALLGALPTFVTEANALASAVNADKVSADGSAANATAQASGAAGQVTAAATQVALAAAQAAAAANSAASALAAPNTSATSTTSVSAGIGTKVFTTQTGKPFANGQAVIVSSRADPRIFMLGSVTSYGGSTLTVNVLSLGLPGAAADWDIAFTGALPVQSKPGRVLRSDGAIPSWGDARGQAVQVLRRTNLLLWSEDFSNAAWARAGTGSVTTGGAGAPDGTATFNLLNDTDSTFDLSYWQQSISTTPAVAAYCGSIYLSPGTAATTRLVLYTFASAAVQTVEAVEVDWATLAVTGGGFIEAVPGAPGVYRMWREFRDVGGGTSITFRVYASSGGAAQTGTVKVWGAMVNAGRVPGLYAKTTTVAASAPSARTQRLLYTENFFNAAWNGVGTIPVNEQFAIGPQGRQTACLLNDTDTAADQAYRNQTVSITSGLTWYASSVKVKYYGAPRTQVFMFLVGGTTVTDVVTLDWNAITAVPTVTTGANGEVTALADGWYQVRLKIQDNNTGNTVATLRVYPAGAAVAATGATLVDQPVLDIGHRAPNYQQTTSGTVTAGHMQASTRSAYHVDTTLGALSIALPDSAQPDDWIEVADVGGAAATNNITLLRSGDLIAGLAEDLVINLNNAAIRLVKDITKGWVIA